VSATASPRYTAYISSPEWYAVRDAKLNQVGHRCQECGDSERLEVHHLSYDRFENERLEDLQVLCHFCHMREHGLPVHGVGPIAGLTDADHVRRGTGPTLLQRQREVAQAVECERLATESDELVKRLSSLEAVKLTRQASRCLRAAARILAA